MATMIATLMLALVLPLAAQADWIRPIAPGPSRITAIDLQFLRESGADALGDLELGRLALARSGNEDVRALALMMVEKAESLHAGLSAQAAESRVGLPQAPSRAAEALLEDMAGLHGATFDRAFVAAAFEDLRDDQLRLLTRANQNGTDPVARLAREAVAPTRAALSAARRLHDATLLARMRADDRQNAYLPDLER